MFSPPRVFRKFIRFSSLQKTGAPPTVAFPEFPEFKSFEELHRFSVNNHEEFWGKVAKSQIKWHKEFTITANNDFKGRISNLTYKFQIKF